MIKIAIILACSCRSFAKVILDSSKDVIVHEVQLGSSATIPCDLLLSEDGKNYPIKVITWYKNSQDLPIYRSVIFSIAVSFTFDNIFLELKTCT